MNTKHFAISLDDFSQTVFDVLSRNHDGPAAHYARFSSETKEQAVERAMAVIKKAIEAEMYESDSYGYRIDL